MGLWARVVGLPMWQRVQWWKANPPQPRPHKVGGNISPRTLLLLVIGAGLLAGCGASLNGEFAAGGSSNESGLRTSSPMAAAEPGAGPAAALPQPTPRTNGYRIGPLDVLEISVFKVPELSTSVQVAETGTINLPLVGEISASGRTAQDVERDLTAKLGAKYLRAPQVSVFVKEYNSQRVTVEGAVKKPGVYPMKGRMSLLQSIAMAEELDPAYKSTVIIFRQADGERLAARFNIDDIKNGRSEDPPIHKGDVVVVNTSTTKKAFGSILRNSSRRRLLCPTDALKIAPRSELHHER